MSEPIYASISHRINMLDVDKILTPETKFLMTQHLDSFCDESIRKFIKGQKEHGGKLSDRNLKHELKLEHIDMFWYLMFQENGK